MKNGTKVRVLLDVPGICYAGYTGTVTEYPYCGERGFAFVELDTPQFCNGYPFKLSEVEVVPLLDHVQPSKT